MARFALIEKKTVILVVQQQDMPTAPGLWVDITGQHVGPGFTYNSGTGNFKEPAAPVYAKITTEAFWERFTPAEEVLFETASWGVGADAAKLRVFRRAAGENGFVNLNKTKTQNVLTSLESPQNGTTILAPGRAAEIFGASITADEAYGG